MTSDTTHLESVLRAAVGRQALARVDPRWKSVVWRTYSLICGIARGKVIADVVLRNDCGGMAGLISYSPHSSSDHSPRKNLPQT